MAIKYAPNFIKGVWGLNCAGMLGMAFAPGRFKPHQPNVIRNLEQDLNILKNQFNVKTLVSLIQEKERPIMRIQDKRRICQRLQIKHMGYPIADFGIPTDTQSFKQFVKSVVDKEIRKDKVVLAHCKAGLGRTGMFASACLIYVGMGAQQAINLVRKTRNGTIETQGQVQFVKSLKF